MDLAPGAGEVGGGVVLAADTAVISDICKSRCDPQHAQSTRNFMPPPQCRLHLKYHGPPEEGTFQVVPVAGVLETKLPSEGTYIPCA